MGFHSVEAPNPCHLSGQNGLMTGGPPQTYDIVESPGIISISLIVFVHVTIRGVEGPYSPRPSRDTRVRSFVLPREAVFFVLVGKVILAWAGVMLVSKPGTSLTLTLVVPAVSNVRGCRCTCSQSRGLPSLTLRNLELLEGLPGSCRQYEPRKVRLTILLVIAVLASAF